MPGEIATRHDLRPDAADALGHPTPVLAASGNDDWFDWETELRLDPPWRELLIAEIDGRPIGVIQIIDPREEETHYWGHIEPNLRAIDIWIGEAFDLGRGYGTLMMHEVLDRCFAGPNVIGVLIDPLAANCRAHRFYERFGFRAVGRRVFDKDECIVYRLLRAEWEAGRAPL